MKAGAVYKYDLSLPPEKMYALVEEMRERLGNQLNITIKTIAWNLKDILWHLRIIFEHNVILN